MSSDPISTTVVARTHGDKYSSFPSFHCPACSNVNMAASGCASCARCGRAHVVSHDIYDLVSAGTDRGAEQRFYDSVYGSNDTIARRDIATCEVLWHRGHQPELEIVRRAVGNVAGKDVLLLGNGASEKELAFLCEMPRILVYSDLSTLASLRVQRAYDFTPYRDRVMFAALDAQRIPFIDQSFDIVYGYAMVHHLPDLRAFVDGVKRVLRPGGRAVFLDDAFAPLWHGAKQTVLKPLMEYSHKATGISPEDYRFSMSGGFKETDLAAILKAAGCEPWFERTSLVTYVTFRAIEKLLPPRVSDRLKSSALARVTTTSDRILGRFRAVRTNQIRLAWGFTAPHRGAAVQG